MRKITLDGKEYNIYGSGTTLLIMYEDLHEDIFEVIRKFMTGLGGKKSVSMIDTAKLCYAFIKTANPDLAPDFHTFMSGIRNAGGFIEQSNLVELIAEVNDLMNTGKAPEQDADKQSSSKKKKTA